MNIFLAIASVLKPHHLHAILILFMIDFITDIMASVYLEIPLDSHKWINGILRKFAVFIAIFVTAGLSYLLEYKVLFDLFYMLFFLGEVKSIFENLKKMDIPGMREVDQVLGSIVNSILKKIKDIADTFKK